MQLARQLRVTDYFTLGFGSMVGVGWLVVMDDWLGRGGPLGAILGFALGGIAILPIGYVYGRLAAAMPDAGSEIAYTAAAFGPRTSFATGWMMTLAYLIVCPWEAVAIGKIAAYIAPALNSFELYRVAGKPVYLPHLLVGLALTAAITFLNYRGIRSSATFQNWTTFGLLALFAVFASFGVARGSVANFAPLFRETGALVSVLLMLQVVPYFMTGWESIPKCAEEARVDFRAGGFTRAMLLAIVGGMLFYTAIIAVVAWVAPWQTILAKNFSTAYAFEQVFGAGWIVTLILVAALLSLLKCFNGNFVAASRLLFALGRRERIPAAFARIHAANHTPHVAVVTVGVLTAAAAFFGEAILIPITEVGSLAAASGWLAASAAFLRLEKRTGPRAVAVVAILVAAALISMKLLPNVPGHFTWHEYVALALWCAAGLALHRKK